MRPALCIVLFALTGCARLFFHPDQNYVITPEELRIAYQDVQLEARDGTRLHGWLLLARQDAVATVLFLHGNAQNISAHIASVYWLVERRLNVFLLDYRGYGESEGRPSLAGIHADAETALQYLARQGGGDRRPLIVFGQSLGGAVAIYTVARTPYRHRIKAVIVEGAFASYPQIAREKLAQWWMTWPLQLIPYVTLRGTYDPVRAVPELSPIPLLIIHGEADPIVPPVHAHRLYDAAEEPRQLWLIPDAGHIEAFGKPNQRDRLVRYLHEITAGRVAQGAGDGATP